LSPRRTPSGRSTLAKAGSASAGRRNRCGTPSRRFPNYWFGKPRLGSRRVGNRAACGRQVKYQNLENGAGNALALAPLRGYL